MTHKTVGVIGGMGPEATIELMQRVVRATPADDDSDHIHMLVDNNPKIPSRIQHLLEGTGENPGPTIAAMARGLEQGGADFLVIPCNTAHFYHHYAQDAVSIPVWNMIELSLQQIKILNPAATSVGLLASTAVRKIQLFEPFFKAQGQELVYPDEHTQDLVMNLIRSVKSASYSEDQLQEYNQHIALLEEDGAQSLLLGCSELSVLKDRHEQQLPVIDTLQILANSIVDHCKDS